MRLKLEDHSFIEEKKFIMDNSLTVAIIVDVGGRCDYYLRNGRMRIQFERHFHKHKKTMSPWF